MARLTRNTAVLAKLEATYGIDSVPTGAADAILVSNQSINVLSAQNQDRGLVRPYMGASEQLLGSAYKELSYDVELAGSGTAGTAPKIGRLIRGAGFAETLTASTRVDYTLVSEGFESLTQYYFDDGVLHKLLGCRASLSLSAKISEKPTIGFKWIGLDGGDVTGTPGTTSLSAFKTPKVITNANTSQMMLGGTVSASGAPAITGGSGYTSQGIEVDGGQAVNFIPLVGIESVEITDRVMTGKVVLDMTASQEVAKMQDVRGATLSAISMIHGTDAGNKILIHCPNVQFTNPTKVDVNGRRMIGYDLRMVPDPAGTGNDEFRLVFF